MSEIRNIINSILQFRDDRDWAQFHNSKDLAIAISVESNELLEQFLWIDAEQANKAKIKEELADILIYTLLLVEKENLDVVDIIREKIQINSQKYPVKLSKGSSKKYTDF